MGWDAWEFLLSENVITQTERGHSSLHACIWELRLLVGGFMICYGSSSLTGMAGRVCSKQKKNNYSFKLQKPFALARALPCLVLLSMLILFSMLILLVHFHPCSRSSRLSRNSFVHSLSCLVPF